MARILIVEGAGRGLSLAASLIQEGHAVRLVARDPSRRADVEAIGAEFRSGDPDRLATLLGVLEHVTIACWLLAEPHQDPDLLRALHGARLERFLCSAIDSTLRGFVYEAGGAGVPAHVLAHGIRIVSETTAQNSIPMELLRADPADPEEWLARARAAVRALLG